MKRISQGSVAITKDPTTPQITHPQTKNTSLSNSYIGLYETQN